jgi:hypothetical protein
MKKWERRKGKGQKNKVERSNKIASVEGKVIGLSEDQEAG